MLSVCAVGCESDEKIIKKKLRETDPTGSVISAKDCSEMMELIAGHPDIVWLEATADNLELISSCACNDAEINYIFIAKNDDLAADALAVRASGFIHEPVTEADVADELRHLRYPVKTAERKLRVQCFGNFEVFADGEAIHFSRSLSKEAFAYLVDRRGAGCTVREICSVLWEDRPADTSLKSQCRVILSALRRDLEQAGAGNVLFKGWNLWSVDTEKITCDYYDYLSGRQGSDAGFMGEYMSQYSWAELTRGSLFRMANE